MNEIAVTALAAPIPKSGPLQIGDQLANLARHLSTNPVSFTATIVFRVIQCNIPGKGSRTIADLR